MANKTLPQLYVDNPITVPAATALVELSQGGVSGAVQVQNLAPLRAVHTFTQAELLHLVGTPITLIAAPGAGYAIMVLDSYSLTDFVAGGYSYAGTGASIDAHTGTINQAILVNNALVTDKERYVKIGNLFAQNLFNTDLLDNLPLIAYLIDDDTGDPAVSELTGGNVASKAYVVVHYYIVPTSVP